MSYNPYIKKRPGAATSSSSSPPTSAAVASPATSSQALNRSTAPPVVESASTASSAVTAPRIIPFSMLSSQFAFSRPVTSSGSTSSSSSSSSIPVSVSVSLPAAPTEATESSKERKERTAKELAAAVATLSPDQLHAYRHAIDHRHNVLILGQAGTGKSHLLTVLIKALNPKKTGVTSMTGRAAIVINGMTLHSFLGMGPVKETPWKISNRVLKRHDLVARIQAIDVLIIDEFSMCSAEVMEVADMICRRVRAGMDKPAETFDARQGLMLPFGGIRIIMCGDKAQLQPVEGKPIQTYEPFWGMFQAVVELKTVFRQNEDLFLRCLRDIRLAKCFSDLKKETIDILMSRTQDNLHKAHQRQAMEAALAQQRQEEKERMEEASREDQLEEDMFAAAEEAMGIAKPASKPPRVNTDVLSSNPIILTATKNDASGHNYRALALLPPTAEKRAYQAEDWCAKPTYQSVLDSLITNCPAHTYLKLVVGAKVVLTRNIAFDRKLVNGARGTVARFSTLGFPVVQFESGVTEEVLPFAFDVQEFGVRVASRTQIPLIYGWALTIHYSQGMTLQNVSINLSNVFVAGQTYVALSRVSRLNGLVLLHPPTARCIVEHKDAIEFESAPRPPTCLCYKLGCNECASRGDATGGRQEETKQEVKTVTVSSFSSSSSSSPSTSTSSMSSITKTAPKPPCLGGFLKVLGASKFTKGSATDTVPCDDIFDEKARRMRLKRKASEFLRLSDVTNSKEEKEAEVQADAKSNLVEELLPPSQDRVEISTSKKKTFQDLVTRIVNRPSVADKCLEPLVKCLQNIWTEHRLPLGHIDLIVRMAAAKDAAGLFEALRKWIPEYFPSMFSRHPAAFVLTDSDTDKSSPNPIQAKYLRSMLEHMEEGVSISDIMDQIQLHKQYEVFPWSVVDISTAEQIRSLIEMYWEETSTNIFRVQWKGAPESFA